ncbi:hypothetical protein D9758_002109 [Tetrapyrgos nigripes]|uniref:Uncharacterized protein n=1 Tax=Tetrapyrgos nigripes TaxID=182062 RepID=A0A8H5LVD9_9AGAR|nr:hypothetical protein D9758_002109 [Tetrapyrgos nigripes]
MSPLFRSSRAARIIVRTNSQSRQGFISRNTFTLLRLALPCVIIGGGYLWYQSSGLKKTVEAAKQLKDQAVVAAQNAHTFIGTTITNAQPAANDVLDSIRDAVSAIPGAASAVTALFKPVESIMKEHKDEAAAILQKAKSDIEAILQRRNELKFVELYSQITVVLRSRFAEIKALADRDKDV